VTGERRPSPIAGDRMRRTHVRELYDSMSDTYDNVDAEAFYANQYDVYARHLQRWRGRLDARVLDLGCGTGLQTVLVARWARHMVGLDIARRLLGKARRRCAGGPAAHFVEADATSLPFPDAAFDAVISYGEALSHLLDPAPAFAELARVVRPGGTLIFSVLNAWNVGLLYHPAELLAAGTRHGQHDRYWTCEDDDGRPTALALRAYSGRRVRALCAASGFAVVDAEAIHVTSLLVPLACQRSFGLAARAYRALGGVDRLVSRRRGWRHLGYTCIYAAHRLPDAQRPARPPGTIDG